MLKIKNMGGTKMKRKINWNWIRVLSYFLILLIPLLNFAGTAHAAASLDTTVSDADKAKFDQILTPVTKIYTFIKYAASLIAAIALLFAGITYMFSGNDIRKRETSKHMAAYVLLGLGVIWAAPFVVNLLIG